ncbi:MAG TPA: FUSC family protein [Tepidisphaeraceae bacterium]|nr:FUSC family protein [Tepidisphaeraceae bacterium]
MLPSSQKPSFLRTVQAEPRPLSQSLRIAASFGIQAALCAAILYVGYPLLGLRGVEWATVSACLVLQPDSQRSFAVAVGRVLANFIGAFVGLALGQALGISQFVVILALVATSFICSILRLDPSLRIACVAAIIVLATSSGNVARAGFERFAYVTVGCVVGLIVQLLAMAVQRSVYSTKRLPCDDGADG